jgi:hypothetical protein
MEESMAREGISFNEASGLLSRHGPRFGGRDVVGVAIDERENALRFIVAVSNEKTRERLAKKYEGQSVSGLPVFVERRNVKSLAGMAGALPLPASRPDRPPLWREVVDRPGYLVVAGLVFLALAALWAA